MSVRPVRWENGELTIIDQTLLPTEYKEVTLRNRHDVWHAIKVLQVRGAPAIGVSAAFGVLVALKERPEYGSVNEVVETVRDAAEYLATSRPTAVNLFWALDRMQRVAESGATDAESPGALIDRLEKEAIEICEEDTRRCRAIGDHGAELIHDGYGLLTHCNAGALATSSYGTALAPMFRAHELGRTFHVFADETRPLLQGARLTVWELMHAGIDVTLICDNTAAQVMREGRIQMAIVGADRIAANGDVANKIGTYTVALTAKAHGVPFYVAAPLSTFDPSISTGELIPIEQRAPEEVTHGFGRQTAPDDTQVYSPAFDVTPADLIAGIITEQGILRPPFSKSIAAVLDTGR